MGLGIADAITAGLGVINKFIPDPAAKAQAEAELRASLQAWDKQQNDVNAAEAANTNLFVAGWRPAVGWVCALALLYQYVASPIGMWLAAIALSAGWLHTALPAPPKLDDSLWQLLTGMLGFGALRTYEKVKGVASGH